MTDQGKYDPVKSLTFNEDIKVCVSSKGFSEQNVIHIYHLIWGQYSLSLKSKLSGIDGIKNQSDAYYIVWLLDQVYLLPSGIDNSYNIYHNNYVDF